MDELQMLRWQFSEVKTSEEHKGYYYRVADSLLIAILGTFCGLRDIREIHQWADSEIVSRFLVDQFGITQVPCYSWLTQLLQMIDAEWLNTKFSELWQQVLPKDRSGLTVSFDGKTIRSTEKMSEYEQPLHIISAQVAELGVTIGQLAVEGKTNEIPTVRELLGMLDVRGCMVVADALNCQKDTAKAIIRQGADYLLSVKDNQPTLKADIEMYVQDEDLRRHMDTATTRDVRSDREEIRTAFVTSDIDWLRGKAEWESLACIGAINTQFNSAQGRSNEWHYYISSRNLTALELLKHARAEWSVESMHWLLDVHWGEDGCKVRDANVQKILNLLRKLVINSINQYKQQHEIKTPTSRLLFANLLDCYNILSFVEH